MQTSASSAHCGSTQNTRLRDGAPTSQTYDLRRMFLPPYSPANFKPILAANKLQPSFHRSQRPVDASFHPLLGCFAHPVVALAALELLLGHGTGAFRRRPLRVSLFCFTKNDPPPRHHEKDTKTAPKRRERRRILKQIIKHVVCVRVCFVN